MYIERILSPIVSLGPGNRAVIWVQGCSKNCKGCISPEMQQKSAKNNIPVKEIAGIIQNIFDNDPFDGITISGGDPMEQMDELLELLHEVRSLTNDILVYTGYYWEDLRKKINIDDADNIKKLITVLIDGPYVEDLNSEDIILRGSSNQNIIFFDENYKSKYSDYMEEGRKLQNIYVGNALYTVGIMNK